MVDNTLLVIRIRGEINLPNRVSDTLRMLRVDKNYHATLIDDRPSYAGMLQEAKDYITWGEADKDTIELLLRKRGRNKNGEKLSEEYLKKYGHEDFSCIAQKIHEGKNVLSDFKFLKPYFRLHPPKGGFKKSLKQNYGKSGELGYRGNSINDLARRMT